MKLFKSIRKVSDDIVERARAYRKHEDGCDQCMKARLVTRPYRQRCKVGQTLWNEVGL